MSIRLYLFRRKLKGLLNRMITSFRKLPQIRIRTDIREDIPGVGTKIIWSTLVTSKRPDELEVAYLNLRSLSPFLLWSSLTVDGTADELELFVKREYRGGFDNLLWLKQPKVVSTRGYYAGKMGHFNRISLNYMRGWLCNLEQGEETSAYLFCHTDGDWRINIRPESLERLYRFFHERPEVIAISRHLDRYLTQEPNMWPNQEDDEAVWYGTSMLSTNLIIAPIDRIRPLVLDATRVFPDHRAEAIERVLGKLIAEREMVVAYPKLEYFKKNFLIDVQEEREPFTEKGVS